MTIVQGTTVYSNVDRRLVTFDEPADSILQITPGAFGAPMNGPQLNTFTFQFSGGGGGAPTMAIAVMGPTGAFSAYTNSAGTAATGITAGTAYAVDTGSWTQFRVTWTGSDASAVLSVLGWNNSASVPELQAELATAQADIQALQTEVVPLRDGFIFATDYGLVTGGDRDDADANTLALQAALNAAGDADTVVLPAGRIAIGDGVTSSKSIRIIGAGVSPWTPIADVFGGGGWGTASSSAGQGSILETELDAGSVLSIHGATYNPQVTLENFAIRGIGDNTRTVVGIDAGDGTHAVRVNISSVSVWNLAVGFLLVNAEDGVGTAMQARGCGQGLSLGLNSNSNVWTGFDASSCNTSVLLDSNAVNYFVGGTIQGSRDFGIQVLGGSEHEFQSIYFESSVGAALAISLERDGGHGTGGGGNFHRITGCHFGDVGDGVEVWTSSNKIDATVATISVTLQAGANSNSVYSGGAFTVTDTDGHNINVITDSFGMSVNNALTIPFGNTAEQTITGSVGTVETAFSDTGVPIAIPAGMIHDNDRLRFAVEFDVVSDAGGATDYTGRLRWGGLTGVSLGGETWGISASASVVVTGEITWRTAGASPAWHSWSRFSSPATNGFIKTVLLKAQTTIPTDVSQTLMPTVQFVGAGTSASDQIACVSLTCELVRGRRIPA